MRRKILAKHVKEVQRKCISVCIKIDIAIRISAMDVRCQPDLDLTSANVLGTHLRISDFVMTSSASRGQVRL